MPIVYDSNAIIPGPFVQIVKEFVRSEDGKLRKKFFTIVARGKLVAFAGSPRSDGSFWNAGIASPPPNESIPESGRLASIRSKQAALMALFDRSGKTFEIQPFDGSPPTRFNPRIKSVEFPEGKWADTCDYSIQMEADNVWFGGVDGGGGSTNVEPEESWAFESDPGDGRSYRVSHSVSSQQRASFDENGNVVKEGWENARDVVLPRTGVGPAVGLMPPLAQSGFLAANYSRSQTVDEASGKFSVTENWVYVQGQRYLEDFSVNCRIAEGVTHVTVEGTVTGYSDPDPALTAAAAADQRLARARDAWETGVFPNLLERAQNYSGITLNPLPASQTVGFNPVRGVVTFNYEFDNRPANFIPGSLSESVSVQQQNPTDVIAQLIVLGRPAGPIIQPIGTTTAKVRSVTIEVVVPPWLYGQPVPAAPDVSALLLDWFPGGYLTKDDESWLPRQGRYSRSVAWTY